MTRTAKLFFGLCTLAATVLGCGQNGPNVCCYSGAYYDCSDTNEVSECVSGQPMTCKRDASKDNLCQNQ